MSIMCIVMFTLSILFLIIIPAWIAVVVSRSVWMDRGRRMGILAIVLLSILILGFWFLLILFIGDVILLSLIYLIVTFLGWMI